MNIIRIAVTGGIQDPVSACETLFLGHVGERGVTQVELDYSAWVDAFGPGTVSLEILRSGDELPYTAELSQDASARRAVWTVSDVDTGKYGYGNAGFVYVADGAVKRSEIFAFFVDRSVGGPGPPPDPYEGTIAMIRRMMESAAASAAAAEQAADQAAAAVVHPPVIDSDGTWLVWDPSAGQYTDSGKPSAGAEGFSPTFSVERIPGGQQVTVTDRAGAHTFVLLDAFGREGEGINLTDGAGGSWYIPEGEGPRGSIPFTDGENVWYLPPGLGAGTDLAMGDGAGGFWYIPGKAGGGSGTTDYSLLTNVPAINEHSLASGENSLASLGIGRASSADINKLF